ncbi:hypothetical protein LguiB_020873 [Lonicera macranthoides]
MESYGPRKRKQDPTFGCGDFNTDKAALRVSASVVSLVSQTGGKHLFMGSGTIIDSADVNGIYVSTILTSASILRSSCGKAAIPSDIKVDVYLPDGRLFEGKVSFLDFHYNIATVKIDSDEPQPIAIIRHLDDSISVNPSESCSPEDEVVGSESFQIHPHSEKFNLSPGDMVVAIGRYFKEPYDLMVAPGKFSLDCCKFDCKELFRTNCKISNCGIGGPLINRDGEVIGVNFYDKRCTPFLAINIASKCLEHFEKYRTFCRPWLGMEATNLYAASLGYMEKIIQKFPNIFKGVIVEQVTKGSPADCAGILPDDVIIECCGNSVHGFLEFLGMLFDKAESKERRVDLVVLRGKTGARLNVTVAVEEATTDRFYRWPLPKQRSGPTQGVGQQGFSKEKGKRSSGSAEEVWQARLLKRVKEEKRSLPLRLGRRSMVSKVAQKGKRRKEKSA